MQKLIEKVVIKLNLPESRNEKIKLFLETVSYYKLIPYVDFIKNNPQIAEKINKKTNGKDAWDAVTFLYRYNIKMSKSLYHYIYLLETTIKTKVNNLLCSNFGNDWFINPQFVHRANKSSVNYLQKKTADYIKEVNIPNVMDFVENHTTFGYWVAIIESGNLWNSNDIKIRRLFSANEKINTATLSHKNIANTLKSINDLRNCISHHNQVIGCKIGKKGGIKKNIIEIYNEMLNIFELLGCEDLNWMIGDINCCPNGTFELLYKEFEFIHSYDIKADKAQQTSPSEIKQS